jgi:predicted enzyme related to lactoylglutathione lyase
MIVGVHAMLYTTDAEADRAFLRDVLKWKHVDAGGGWLIFAMPPAEMGVHPSEEGCSQALYLMTDDVNAEVAQLQAAGVKCDPVQDQGWGLVTELTLPSGGKLGLYQPRHPMAHS